jgi:cysteine desulfurase
MTYLDHAATTPMLPQALAAVTTEMGRCGNPSSLHAAGRSARRVVEESREAVAAALGARPGEVIFCAGGTEADNIALKGLYWARHAADPARRRVLISAVEHHAVLDPALWLERCEGAELELLEVDQAGRVRPETLAAALARDPGSIALVSVMWANNEVGTVQPIAELAERSRAAGVPFHTDAIAAFGAVPVDFAASGVDALSVTAHKVGGPVGVGALLLARGVVPEPLLHGGGQEQEVHSGTVAAPLVAGFAVAAGVAAAELEVHAKQLAGLRDELVAGVGTAIPDSVLNGDPVDRLPGNVHFSFPGCEGDSLLMLLDARGIECSTGSACSAGVARPSHVLLAMGRGEETARSSLRFSLGRTSTVADVTALLAALPPVVERARQAGAAAAVRRG